MKRPGGRTARVAAAAALVLSHAAGCGTDTELEGRAGSLVDYPDCSELGAPLVEHACFHAERGPFGDGVQAYPLVASVPADTTAAPNVNAVHSFFAVALPDSGAGVHEGGVRYRPNRTGDWAIFVTPDAPVPAPAPNTAAPPAPDPPRPMVPIRVLTAAGAMVPVELQQAVAGCNRLPRVGVHKLTAGQTYQIVLGPSGVPRAGLVLEKLADFEAPVFRDADGDGHGAAAMSRVTACKPPGGQVTKDDDCDDGAVGVFPGAPELCNRIDDDCDGTSDEGLMCAMDAAPAAPDTRPPEDDGAADLATVPQDGLAPADAPPPPDAGSTADLPLPGDVESLAVPTDAAPDQTSPHPADGPAPDTGVSSMLGSGDGCGCALGNRPRPSGGAWLLLVVALAACARDQRRLRRLWKASAWSR
jgi:Putative metal-binding motif